MSAISEAKNIVNRLESFLDSGSGISLIRGIDWDRRYLWFLDFEVPADDELKLQAPFDRFFPASEVSLNNISVESEEFQFGQNRLSFPKGQASTPTMTINFYDDINRTLIRWFYDWVNLDIQNNGMFVSGLLDSHTSVAPDSFGKVRAVRPIRRVKVTLLNLDRSVFSIQSFDVVPTGDIAREFSNAAEAATYNVTFNIVGDYPVTRGESNSGVLGLLKELANRVI